METEITTMQNEVSEVTVSEEAIGWCSFLGLNLYKLFKIKNASIAVTLLIVILYLFYLHVGVRVSMGLIYVMSAVVVILALGLLGISIAMIVLLFRMGKYNDGFRYAGLFIIISFVISLFSFFVNSWAVPFFSSAFSFLSIFKFINTMVTVLSPANKKVAVGWGKLKKLYIYTLVGEGTCIILATITLARDFSAFVLYVCIIALLVAKIWEINLIYDSANVMNSYHKTGEPTQDEKSSSSAK